MAINMAFYMNNLLSNIKTRVCSCIRFGCQSACDYPVVLGAGFVLLFLHKLCPSLFAFLLSSSPVILLTALLLGALLTYGEPSAPVTGEETLENQPILPCKSKISIADCSIDKVDNVDVKVWATKRSESKVICTMETVSDGIWHGSATHDAENGIPVPADKNTILCAESSELAKSNGNMDREEHAKEICENVQVQIFEEENATCVSADTALCAETSGFAQNEVIVEREECVKEICEEKVELQHFGNTNCERCHYELNNQYQLGELMSSCWQPVMKHEHCSDSESDDLTESSSDASITDIIPMLNELNPSVNLVTDNPSSNFRDNLNSSSDDDDDEYEDGNDSSNEDGAEEQKGGGNKWKEFVGPNSSDMEKNENLESLMERRKAKNILKFELDRRLMDMQATDAIQKMEEASRFRVQVPSISTPRPNPFDPSNGSEEIVELPQIPDSAPSVWRKPFDIPFDQIVDRDNRLQETWTPRLCFPSTQRRKHENFYLRQSTFLQHHNGIKQGKTETGEKDVSGDHSDSDSEQAWNNGKLFGSLEPDVGDEMKILSAAISDVCVLEVSHGTNEGNKSTDCVNGKDSFYIQKSISGTSEVNDSVSTGCEQLLLCSLPEEYSTEKHIDEADSVSEVNSLFKCRMEEVLQQSISESGIDQPFAGKLEHGLNNTLSAESVMPAIEARSVEELNSQFAQLSGEALECAAYDSSCDNESIQYRSSGSLPVVNGVAVSVECKSRELLTEDSELPVLASSVQEMNSAFKELEDEAPTHMPQSPELMVGEHNGETDSGVLVPYASSRENISSVFVHLSTNDDKIETPRDGEDILDSAELNSRLHRMENNALDSDDRFRSDSTKGIEKLKNHLKEQPDEEMCD